LAFIDANSDEQGACGAFVALSARMADGNALAVVKIRADPCMRA
jgi:hypothetical protein